MPETGWETELLIREEFEGDWVVENIRSGCAPDESRNNAAFRQQDNTFLLGRIRTYFDM